VKVHTICCVKINVRTILNTFTLALKVIGLMFEMLAMRNLTALCYGIVIPH